ncbi:MAG: nuclear transport factor 2 family protein [Rhodospirillales bacterium]|nr:nuclear transport factor 2 family protein [Rhodospirillales bacterium]
MPTSDPSTDPVLAALRSLADAFNAHDLDRIMDHFADDAVLEMPRGPDPWGARFTGKAAVRAGLAARFAGLPDVHYGGAVHMAAGETGTSRWTVTGTTPDGRRIRANGCDFYTFRDGLVVKKDSYWKMVEG